MAHPYKGHPQNVVGHRRVKYITRQSGGPVPELNPIRQGVTVPLDESRPSPKLMKEKTEALRNLQRSPFAAPVTQMWMREAEKVSKSVPRRKEED